ncbi:MAG TPA: hypothetical protein VF282_01155 [Bacillota bacterium]
MDWVRVRSFAAGLLTGLFLCLGIAFGIFHGVTQRGFTARVDVDEVAAQVRSQVEMQVAELLPQVLAALKEEVPGRVAQELAGQLDEATFVMYGVTIRLPRENLSGVRAQIERLVSDEIQQAIDEMDVAGAAAEWGARGERLLAAALRAELRGRRLELRVHPEYPWPTVPVVLSVP